MEIPKTLRKYADKIDSMDDDRGTQNGYWLYLKNGWINPQSETHQIHEDTIGAIIRQIREVEICDCEDCRQSTAKAYAELNRERLASR